MSMMNNSRPVTARDIAEKLNKPISTIHFYLEKEGKARNNPLSILINNTAKEMGYDPKAAIAGVAAKRKHGTATCECGTVFNKTSNSQKYCTACQIIKQREYQRKWAAKNRFQAATWHNGNFKTREEEIARMKELRAKGYSNQEIAKMIGRTTMTVWRAIGKQDRELWKQNVIMGAHIRAQKNAARKQYVVNKPIREYNRKVEEHNRMKAEVAKMEAELKPKTPMIQQAAQTKITFPIMNMETIRPTALQ